MQSGRLLTSRRSWPRQVPDKIALREGKRKPNAAVYPDLIRQRGRWWRERVRQEGGDRGTIAVCCCSLLCSALAAALSHDEGHDEGDGADVVRTAVEDEGLLTSAGAESFSTVLIVQYLFHLESWGGGGGGGGGGGRVQHHHFPMEVDAGMSIGMVVE